MDFRTFVRNAESGALDSDVLNGIVRQTKFSFSSNINRQDALDSHSSCPICLEVFEKEIYQCANGHLICSVCIRNVNNCCPHCRMSYGSTKIRSRVLEEILDKRKFDCKFKDKGCRITTNRKEISTHTKSCRHSPDFVPLCKAIGYRNCDFSNASSSRAEIITHFQDEHEAVYEQGDGFRIIHEDFAQHQQGNRPCIWIPVILSFGCEDTGPLILLLGKIHSPVGFASWICVQIWGAEQQGRTSKVSVSLQKGLMDENLIPINYCAINNTTENLRICWEMNALSTKFKTVYSANNHLEIPLSFIQKGMCLMEQSVILSVSNGTAANGNRSDILWKDIWVFARSNDEGTSGRLTFSGSLDYMGRVTGEQQSQANPFRPAPNVGFGIIAPDFGRTPLEEAVLPSELPADLGLLAVWAKL